MSQNYQVQQLERQLVKLEERISRLEDQPKEPRAEEIAKLRVEYVKLRQLATSPFEHAILASLVSKVYSNDR